MNNSERKLREARQAWKKSDVGQYHRARMMDEHYPQPDHTRRWQLAMLATFFAMAVSGPLVIYFLRLSIP